LVCITKDNNGYISAILDENPIIDSLNKIS